jgi:hypothetical protein
MYSTSEQAEMYSKIERNVMDLDDDTHPEDQFSSSLETPTGGGTPPQRKDQHPTPLFKHDKKKLSTIYLLTPSATLPINWWLPWPGTVVYAVPQYPAVSVFFWLRQVNG